VEIEQEEEEEVKEGDVVEEQQAVNVVKGWSRRGALYIYIYIYMYIYMCFSVCNGAESQRLGALLGWRVFYSVHIARRAFSTHGLTNIPHQSNSL